MRITESVKRLEAYVPGEQPKSKRVIKLNTNENPYPPTPKCARVLATFDLNRLRKYPDPVFGELRAALANLHATTPDRIFVGNGSDEILTLLARAFVENDEAIGSLDPSYSLYKTLAAIRTVAWKGGLTVDRDVSLFLWTNPNAPTGTHVRAKEIANFAKKFPGVVVVDEAYADFARENCMKLATAARNSNIIVMRTFSKSYSLAGLRVGYCVGPRELIDALYKVKDSYNVDALAQAIACVAVKDVKYHQKTVARVIQTRDEFSRALRARAWDVPASEANFVFAKPPAPFTAAEVFAKLREKNIFVRYFPGEKTGDRLRITIGTRDEMNACLRAIDAVSRRLAKSST